MIEAIAERDVEPFQVSMDSMVGQLWKAFLLSICGRWSDLRR